MDRRAYPRPYYRQSAEQNKARTLTYVVVLAFSVGLLMGLTIGVGWVQI